MSTKTWVLLGAFIGSSIGAYIPALWGAGLLSYASVFCSGIGGIVGVWLGLKLGD